MPYFFLVELYCFSPFLPLLQAKSSALFFILMEISSSFRLISPKNPIPFNPKTLISKTAIPSLPIPSKPSFFSSISIERIPIKASSTSLSTASSSIQSIEDLPPKLQEIITLFQSVQEPKAKYTQLLYYGRNLTPLDSKLKTIDNKVQGCVSQVWVRAFLDSDKNVRFEADSDSVLTKGLAALLVQGLSGQPVSKILKVSPDFMTLLGLQQSLTPSRNNGFLNMLQLMQKKAIQVYKETEEGGGSVKTGEAESSNLVSEGEVSGGKLNESAKDEVGTRNLDSGMSGIGEGSVAESEVSRRDLNGSAIADMGIGNLDLGNRGQRIREILERELSPVDLEVEDISYQHAGHAGVRGSDGETHFNVRIVSREFEGKSMVKRHRLVYGLLKQELESGLHALSIVAKTPSEIGGE